MTAFYHEARASLFAEFDRLDQRAKDIPVSVPDDQSGTAWEEWQNQGAEALQAVIALPNTPDNLKLRARAIGSGSDNTDDVATLNLDELAAHAHGHVGEIIRQVLVCVSSDVRPASGHVAWLATRDQMLRIYNENLLDDAHNDSLIEIARRLERGIIDVPAKCPDELLAKALLVVGVSATERDEDAMSVFAEAKAFGLIEYEA